MSDEREPVGDRTIDDVARQMTARPMSADFGARVIARIAADERPRRVVPATWALGALGAAAVIVLAFVVRPHERSDISNTNAATAGLRPSVHAAVDSAAAPQDAQTGASARPQSTNTTAANRTVLQLAPAHARRPKAGTTAAADAIDALAPERLEVPSIDIGAMAAEPIVVPRMDALASIVVAPLAADGSRQ